MKSDRFPFSFVIKAINPIEVVGPQSGTAMAVSTDTRTMSPHALFIALIGPNFDAHDHLEDAIAAGARGLVVSRSTDLAELAAANPRTTFFVVPDTLKALGDLAAAYRMQQDPVVVAISGSNGKTTTKEILASIISQHHRVLKTEGNFNNLIGLPLTLLRLDDEPIAVVELGISIPGEMERLADIAKPDIALLTNVTAAHLEQLGSVEETAKEKGKLFDALDPARWAIVNLDNPHTAVIGKTCTSKVITFSLNNPNADFYAESITKIEGGQHVVINSDGESVGIDLPLYGNHNVSNLLGAMACASALGLMPDEMIIGTAKVCVPGSRLRIMDEVKNYLVVDDCYNANPASMASGLQLLSEIGEGKRLVAVVGDMLELGDRSPQLHTEVGEIAAKHGIDHILAFGRFSADIAQGAATGGMKASQLFATELWPAFEEELKQQIRPGDAILVKASRGMKLERAVAIIAKMDKELFTT